MGFEIAKKLSGSNQIILVSTNEDKLKHAAAKLKCDYLICDVTDWKQVEETIRSVAEKYNRLDVLINSAGKWIGGELEQNDLNRIKLVLEVNTLGTIWFSKAVIPQMKKQRSGLIININSQSGLVAKKQRTIYNASKWAITCFTKALYDELKEYNIGVTGIYPAQLSENMENEFGEKVIASDGLDLKEVAKTIEFILSLEPATVFPEIGITKI